MHSMKNILIVEDNADWRELLTMILKRLGYEVFMAVTGEDGVEKAFATQPDLILMDLGLPKMSGDEATARIKSNPATKDIPIVIQTAFDMGPCAERAMKAGAVDIMQKPINVADIQAILKKYLPTVVNTPIVPFSAQVQQVSSIPR
jgi:CheY-like chemotaxis protein